LSQRDNFHHIEFLPPVLGMMAFRAIFYEFLARKSHFGISWAKNQPFTISSGIVNNFTLHIVVFPFTHFPKFALLAPECI
jgi:hypothetical protein